MSPRTEESNQRIREEQRERILEAARTIFAHKGFTDTKMTDIAAAAGVSYGLAYHYFKDKEEIFTRLVEWALSGALGLMQRALEMPGTPWDRLHWFLSQSLQGVQEEPEAFMVVLQAFTNDMVPQETREIAWKQTEASEKAFKQLIIEGQAAGQVVAGNPDQLTTILAWCIQGMALNVGFLNHPPSSDSKYLSSGLPSADDILRLLKA
ncbi:MAG TPA: TetR/AcrR family transcriptional regulator [Ktedonobacteraceae bacterium]|nr:TetR/AcrR family transcriptional regulator [Ktedonobacteraceae bacterium]